MTKEELKLEAKEFVLVNSGYSFNEFHGKKAIQIYLAGAEPREKRIAELEAQIEKMKCCGNCKHSNQESVYSIVCKVGGVDKSDYINVDDNQVCAKWEIKEK